MKVLFSLAAVDSYDGPLNCDPTNQNYSDQSLKRDEARQVFVQAIPHVQGFNNILQSQQSISQVLKRRANPENPKTKPKPQNGGSALGPPKRPSSSDVAGPSSLKVMVKMIKNTWIQIQRIF